MAQESWKLEQEEPSCSPIEPPPPPCANGCGFLGSPATMNLCSSCYRDIVALQPHPASLIETKNNNKQQENEKTCPPISPSPPPSSSATTESSAPLSPPPLQKMKMMMMAKASSSPPLPPAGPSINSKFSELSPLRLCSVDSSPSSAASPSPSSRGVRSEDMTPTSLRCSCCRKKVLLRGFKCRCGGVFCSEHRLAESHPCSFDYKAAGKVAIARDNPLIKPQKLCKI